MEQVTQRSIPFLLVLRERRQEFFASLGFDRDTLDLCPKIGKDLPLDWDRPLIPEVVDYSRPPELPVRGGDEARGHVGGACFHNGLLQSDPFIDQCVDMFKLWLPSSSPAVKH